MIPLHEMLRTDKSIDIKMGFPGGSDRRESACNARDPASILGSGRSLSGNPLQNSCLENPMNKGAWQITIHGLAKSRTQLRRDTRVQIRVSWRLAELHSIEKQMNVELDVS